MGVVLGQCYKYIAFLCRGGDSLNFVARVSPTASSLVIRSRVLFYSAGSRTRVFEAARGINDESRVGTPALQHPGIKDESWVGRGWRPVKEANIESASGEFSIWGPFLYGWFRSALQRATGLRLLPPFHQGGLPNSR